MCFYLSLTLFSVKLPALFLTHWHTFLNWWPTFTSLGSITHYSNLFSLLLFFISLPPSLILFHFHTLLLIQSSIDFHLWLSCYLLIYFECLLYCFLGEYFFPLAFLFFFFVCGTTCASFHACFRIQYIFLYWKKYSNVLLILISQWKKFWGKKI